MNKKYLLSSVTAGIALLYANHGTAQCVTTQDCTALGYTETSCPNGGVKCPFGNKWFCGSSDDTYTENECMELACDKLGFKYDCTGTGYAGGAGTACGGKYTQCTCASGYKWNGSSCKQLNGAQGELYYCKGKVVGVKTADMDFYVAMNDLEQMDKSSADIHCSSHVFCGNIKGRLPTLNQLRAWYYNKSKVNSLLSANGGTKMTGFEYWSSTPFEGIYDYYYLDMTDGEDYKDDGKYYHDVRPVLTSW